MHFKSDNASGVPQEILAALGAANDGFAPGYGDDALMGRVRAQIRDIFEAPQAEVFLVTTGSAANALAIASHCPPWGAVFCHALSHIEMDECGAPEFYTGGAKLMLIAGEGGKITPDALADALARGGVASVHQVQPGLLSLTNLTECGTRYSPQEIAALADLAKARKLPVHLDGARFANALVAEGCSPADISWRAGVDVLSLGGTKNGLMGVEAVVFFDPARAWEFQLRRKRGGHLLSKHRFLSAQMAAWLEDGLWLRLAQQANDAAARLEAGLNARRDARLRFARGGNMLFVDLPRAAHQRLKQAGAQYYLWPDHASPDGPPDIAVTGRLVTSWNTMPRHIADFLSALGPQDQHG
ncbi:MAG: low specificity L-threonine aldolase [Rhodobacteraceae bacterium]|nr:low specificity L-threonine aldolase [Paracoccaceae bacterium]